MSTVPDLVHVEAFNLLCADQIGYGMSRQVFSSRLLPDCVIKIEQGTGHFQNVIEWETWQRVRNTAEADFTFLVEQITGWKEAIVEKRDEMPNM